MAKRNTSAKGGAKADVHIFGDTIASPIGTARYAWLNKPTDFDKYEITVTFEANKEAAVAWEKKILMEAKNALASLKAEEPANKVSKMDPKKLGRLLKVADADKAEKFGVAEGTLYLVVRAPVSDKNSGGIPVVGADKKPTDTPVYGGDTVKVSIAPFLWAASSTSSGLSAYLRAAQLLVSAPRQSFDSTAVFDVEEEFIEDASDDLDDDLGDTEADDEEIADSIPF